MRSLELSKDLEALLQKTGGSLRVSELISVLGDRSFGIALVLFAVPSALPVPAPGYSVPLGVALIIIASQMLFGRKKLWLPRRIREWQVGADKGQKFLRGLIRFLKIFERYLSPRWEKVCSGLGIRLFGILVIALATLMLIPLPLTNTLPAIFVLLVGMGLTEDDGIFSLAVGLIGSLVFFAYVTVFTLAFIYGWDALVHWLESIR